MCIFLASNIMSKPSGEGMRNYVIFPFEINIYQITLIYICKNVMRKYFTNPAHLTFFRSFQRLPARGNLFIFLVLNEIISNYADKVTKKYFLKSFTRIISCSPVKNF